MPMSEAQTALEYICTECGTANPADGWKYTCGSVNLGMFCPECGGRFDDKDVQ
jgi:DNA-directed RNA polymerase subunit RPC12/RpoP